MSSSKIQTYNLDSSIIDSIQPKHITNVITLSVSGWNNNSQTVICNGVTTDNTVILSPSPTSHTAYGSAKVICTAQGVNSLTFTCEEVPESDLTVNVVILGV